MFFILSKILYIFLIPFYWILFLLICIWISKKNEKRKKRLWVITIAIFIIFSNPYLYRTSVMGWQPKPTKLEFGKNYEAGIVLGGMAGYDKYNRGYFGNSADRFIQTSNLYHQGFIKKIVISGGTGLLRQNEPAESFFLRTQFIANGVRDSDIIVEGLSRNTFENAVYSKRIIDSLHMHPPFILITSALHMKRSESVFKKTGLECIIFPCDYKVNDENFTIEDYILPNFSLLNEWSFFLKEIVGLYVYKLTGKA